MLKKKKNELGFPWFAAFFIFLRFSISFFFSLILSRLGVVN